MLKNKNDLGSQGCENRRETRLVESCLAAGTAAPATLPGQIGDPLSVNREARKRNGLKAHVMQRFCDRVIWYSAVYLLAHLLAWAIAGFPIAR